MPKTTQRVSSGEDQVLPLHLQPLREILTGRQDELKSQVAKDRLTALRQHTDMYPEHALKLQETVTPIPHGRRPHI